MEYELGLVFHSLQFMKSAPMYWDTFNDFNNNNAQSETGDSWLWGKAKINSVEGFIYRINADR